MSCISRYPASEYHNSSMGGGGGGHDYEYGAHNMMMAGGGHEYEYGAHNMMMAGGGRKQARHRYKESQALSNYGKYDCGMNRAGRYGEYGQAYNGTGGVVPYSAGVDHMNSTQYQMSKVNTHHGGGYGGGHYPAKKKQQRLQYGGMECNAMNQQQMHHRKRSEKRMVRKMNAMSMSSGSCTTSRDINHDKGNYGDDDENCTSTDSDDDDHDEDSDSWSDYERRRNYCRPMY